MSPPLTHDEQLIERWAAEHGRPCLRLAEPYGRLAEDPPGERGPAPLSKASTRRSSLEGPPLPVTHEGAAS